MPVYWAAIKGRAIQRWVRGELLWGKLPNSGHWLPPAKSSFFTHPHLGDRGKWECSHMEMKDWNCLFREKPKQTIWRYNWGRPHLLPRWLHRKLALALWAVWGHLGLVLSHAYSFLFHHVTKNQVTVLWLPITLMSATLHFLVTVSFLITKPYQPKASEPFHSDSEQEARMASPTPWIRAFPVFVDRKGRMQVWQQWSQDLQLWKPLKPISSHSSSKDFSWGVKHLDEKTEMMTQKLQRAPPLPPPHPMLRSVPWPPRASSLRMGRKGFDTKFTLNC